MNSLTDINSLLKKPESLNCAYWCAYSNEVGDKNRLQDNYIDTNATIESATKKLNDFITDLIYSGCNLEFWFSDTPRPSKGGYRIKFYLPPTSANAMPITQGIGSISRDEAEKIANERFEQRMLEWEAKRKTEELQKEILELKNKLKENEIGPVDRVIGRLEPFLPQIMEAIGFQFKSAASAAVGKAENQNAQTTDQDQLRAEKALTVLAENDPDFILTLEKLAALKQNDPGKYNMAKSML